MTNREQQGEDEYVTRRELYLTLQPLVEQQTQLTEVMTDIGRDVKTMLAVAARHEGIAEAHQMELDRRRFWYTIIASLASGIVVLFVAYLVHAIH